MLRFNLLILVLCVTGGFARAGELVTHTIDSQRLAGNLIGEPSVKDVTVFLPDGYDESQKDYPVVYWFPGGGQTRTSGIRVDELEQEFSTGRADPAIIVFMPVRTTFGSSLYWSSPQFGDWEGFLSEEVIPLIDSTYRTQASAEGRAAMGFSLGGLTALNLPVTLPNTFGAVGGNDPSSIFVSGMVRSEDQYPEGVSGGGGSSLEEFFDAFPDTLEGYKETSIGLGAYGQIAAKLSPNPDHPLGGDLPFNVEGQWLPEAREQWRAFDLLDPESVQAQLDALDDLASVSIILPTVRAVLRPWNAELIRVFEEAGIPANGIDYDGDHNDFRHERFTTLLSNVTYGLKGVADITVGGTEYDQNFDEAMRTTDVGASLPTGWSVSDGSGVVFRDRVNRAFDGQTIDSLAGVPSILNIGSPEDQDRAIGVVLGKDADAVTIQWSADVQGVDANAFSLAFDLETWGKDVSEEDYELGSPTFLVEAELEFSDGSTQRIEVGEFITTSEMRSAEPLDGNSDANSQSFDGIILPASITDAVGMRLHWKAEAPTDSGQWVLGLDDVDLEFFFWGDVDEDNQLTANDIDLLAEAIRQEPQDARFDLDGNGIVDPADRDFLVEELMGTHYGDWDLDQDVDFDDFLVLSANFNTSSTWSSGDSDGDGFVSFDDFLALSANFGESGSEVAELDPVGALGAPGSTSAVAVVPESGCSHYIIMFIFLAATRRRHQA